MKLIKLKIDKKIYQSSVDDYVEKYLMSYNNDEINQPEATEDINTLTDEEINCIIDACASNFFEEFTDSEINVIYKNITRAFSKLIGVATPKIGVITKSVDKAKRGEHEFGRLVQKDRIEIFLPTKEERQAGIFCAPYLQLDILNAIIHELYHIKVNNKIYNALGKCATYNNQCLHINSEKFLHLTNVEQVLLWQNLALEMSNLKGSSFKEYYDYGLEEVYVRINTILQIEKIFELNKLSQQNKDEIIKYLNFMLFEEYYNGVSEYAVMGEKVNQKLFKAMQHNKNKNESLCNDLSNLYDYIQSNAMKGINDYLSLRINKLQAQELNLLEILEQNGLTDLKIKEDNKYVLNYLYALYYKQGDIKKANQIASYNLKMSDLSCVLKNAMYTHKIKKQVDLKREQ